MYISQSNASKALLAVMESHQDMEIVERIYVKIGSPEQLVSCEHVKDVHIHMCIHIVHG